MRLPILVLAILCGAFASAPAIEYPLSVSGDGRNLVDARGDEVVFNAATPWHLGARLTREQAVEYLDARAGQGINALLMALMVTDGYSTGSAANAYGEEPFLSPGDFTRPNEAYFAHVDWIIDQAHQRGMTMFLTPVYLGWQCSPEGWCAEVNVAGPEVMRQFGRWVGERYRDQPNIVWVQGGDVDADAYGLMEHVDAVVAGIKEVDTTHLHTGHCSRNLSARDCYDRPWLDFDTTYSDCSNSPATIRDDYQRFPWMPTLYVEGIYEFEHEVTGRCLRSQAWWAALGGQVGHFFGSGRIWDFPNQWRQGLDTEGTESMASFGRILSARKWGRLIPDYTHDVMIAGYGDINSDSYAATASTADRNSVLAYLPTQRTVTIAMNRVEGTDADAWWIDPVSGSGTLIGRFPTSGTRDFTTPSTGDWVLVIDNASASLSDVWADPATSTPRTEPTRHAELVQTSPNPFNPRTTVSFRGSRGTQLTVSAYDSRGRLVEVLFEGAATGTIQTLTWEPRELASGTYFLRVAGGGETSVRKAVLLK